MVYKLHGTYFDWNFSSKMFPNIITNMLPAVANVYDLFHLLYFPTFIFGVVPFNRQKVKGLYKFKIFEGYRRYSLSTFNTVLLLILALISNEVCDSMEKIFHHLTTTIAVFALNVYSFRSHEVLNAVDLINSAENTMKSLKIDVKYGLPIFAIAFQMVCGILTITLLLIIHTLTYDVLGFFWELVSFGYPSFVMLLPILMVYGLLSTILARFRTLNEFIKERINNDSTSGDEINKLADVHYKLCEAFNKLMYSCGISAIAAYFSIFFQVAFIFYYSYKNIVLDLTEHVDLLIWNVLFTFISSVGIPSVTYIQHVSSKTPRLICQLVSPFTDDDIGTQRNTFLLQLLHQKVDLKVFGHFEVHLSRILPDVQVFVGLLIFFLQISGKAQDVKHEG